MKWLNHILVILFQNIFHYLKIFTQDGKNRFVRGKLSQIKEDKFSGIPCVEAVAGFGEALVKVLSQEEVEVDVSQYRGKVKDFLSEANTKFHSSFNESGYC